MICPQCWRRLVAILERVHSGLLGATVSSFGITGLYITFVFGIGRFLRLSTSNMRMRIPFDDLPNTQRLTALCQVRPKPFCLHEHCDVSACFPHLA